MVEQELQRLQQALCSTSNETLGVQWHTIFLDPQVSNGVQMNSANGC